MNKQEEKNYYPNQLEAKNVLLEIGDEQGWNDLSKIDIMCAFINEHDLVESFREYLRSVQEEEKEGEINE